MDPVIAVPVGLIILVAVVFLVARSRRSHDGVDSFRRQIDALSPEARRPVIDQMYGTNDRSEPRIEPLIEQRPLGDPPADDDTETPSTDGDDRSDQDDTDGT